MIPGNLVSISEERFEVFFLMSNSKCFMLSHVSPTFAYFVNNHQRKAYSVPNFSSSRKFDFQFLLNTAWAKTDFAKTYAMKN